MLYYSLLSLVIIGGLCSVGFWYGGALWGGGLWGGALWGGLCEGVWWKGISLKWVSMKGSLCSCELSLKATYVLGDCVRRELAWNEFLWKATMGCC